MLNITLKLPDGTFNLSDLEKFNAEIDPTEVRSQFCEAIARGHIEVVRKYSGEASSPLKYRKRR
jgi:hypothetical protein